MNTPDDVDLPGEWEPADAPDPDRKRGRRAALIALGLVAVLVVAVGAVVGSFLNGLRNQYDQRTVVEIARGPSDGERPETADGTGRNFLLLGSDRRSEDDDSDVTGERSDVMMLVHVSDDDESVYITSFPRDLYVEIPGHGRDRINAALAFGGLSLAVTTVENYTGVPIDHVALIDFDGVEGLVDSLGGVDVTIPTDFESGGVTFTEGVQHLDGEEALIFARERYSFADGDFQRNRNQQALLQAIVEKLIARDTLTDPGRLSDAVGELSPYLTTDDGLGATAMVDLGFSLRSVRGGDIHYLSVPHAGPTTTSGGASVVATDEDSMDLLRTALQEDTMDDYYAEHVDGT